MSSFFRFVFVWLSVVMVLASGAYVAPTLNKTTKNNRMSSAVWGMRETRSTVLSAHRDTLRMMSATTLDREAVRVAGPAVWDHPQTQERRRSRTDEPTKERKGAGSEAWEVRIYNDGMNTREHVARSLVQVTGMPEMDAYQTMMQAHQNGIAVVGRWVYEVAEMYHDALKKNGIVCDIVPVDEE